MPTHNTLVLEDTLAHIAELFAEKEAEITRLQEENKRLRDEHFASGELARMKEQMENMREAMYAARVAASKGFPISDEESAAISSWMAEHEAKAHGVGTEISSHAFHGVSGGNYTYEFIPTSIGVIGYVVCGACGEKMCFQELD